MLCVVCVCVCVHSKQASEIAELMLLKVIIDEM